MPRDMKIAQPKSLTEIVIERLEQAIVDGEFGLGEAISEETLAKSFGVSRTPVRDALSHLQRFGLVNVISKRGSFVFEPSASDAAELCEYRLMLEDHGIRLAHARAKANTLVATRAAYVEMEAVRETDPIAYGRADTAFHQAFIAYCGNGYILGAYRLAAAKVAALRTHLTAHSAQRRATSFDEHAEMIRLFEAGRLDQLTSLLSIHIDRTRLVYLDALMAPMRASRPL